MSNLAFASYQKPMNLLRDRMFTITGFVKEIVQAKKHTRIVVNTSMYVRTKEHVDDFNVYFTGEIKEFVDKYVKEKFLVDIAGHLVVSSKSTDEMQVIVLEGKHVLVYKNFQNIYVEPKPKYVSPNKLKNKKDLAY